MVTVSQRVLGIENVFHKMLVAQKKVVAAIVQWIHLGLPSLGLGFEWRSTPDDEVERYGEQQNVLEVVSENFAW